MGSNDLNVPRYDYDHMLEMSRKYHLCGLSIWWGMECRKTPPPGKIQGTLFPLLDEIIEPEITKLWKYGKGKGTQVRNLAKKYKTTLKEMKKAIEVAKWRLKAKVLYEEYQQFKEYFDWLYTPEYHEYVKRYIEQLNAENEKRDKEFMVQIEAGTEHVVAIDWLDNKLNEILDYSVAHYEACQSPMSYLAKIMTRKDFDILNERGLIKVVLGKPETLGNYEFAAKGEKHVAQEYIVHQCIVCSESLEPNMIGLNKKLGAKDEGHYKCYQCLGISDEEANNLIEYYKSTGCTMFG
jgi:hypothetical protein